MKRGRRVAQVVLALLVMAPLAGGVWSRERQPQYGGKRLSEWLRECEYGPTQADDLDPAKMARREAAGNAMKKIGVRALPWMLRWVSYERPACSVKLENISGRLPMGGRLRNILRNWDDRRKRLAGDAMLGLEVLGPDAAPAIPELERLIRERRGQDGIVRFMTVLQRIGKASLPALVRTLESRDAFKKRWATDSIIRIKIAAPEADIHGAVPELNECMACPDAHLRWYAVQALGLAAVDDERAYRACLRALNDDAKNVRYLATNAVVNVTEKRALGTESTSGAE